MPLSPDDVSSLLFCPETPHDVTSSVSGPTLHWAPLPSPTAGRPISALLASEHHHMPIHEFAHSDARHNAVNWILNVIEVYRFSPLTAYLAVNYLDRFLSSNTLQGQNGENSEWPMQLLSVACVSVAAKMDETHVPLLLDLQILDPKFVFEPETVTRMELLLMSSLRWRMRSVTPFDYVNRFADLIGAELIAGSRLALISHAADLFVATCRVVDFLKYRPSEIAAAAIICGMKGIADLTVGDCADLLRRLNEWVSEKIVIACVQLMEASLMDTCPKPINELSLTPQSPVGVLDAAACRSCDSSKNKSSSAAILTPNLEANRDQPPAKRLRLDESQCIKEEI